MENGLMEQVTEDRQMEMKNNVMGNGLREQMTEDRQMEIKNSVTRRTMEEEEAAWATGWLRR